MKGEAGSARGCWNRAERHVRWGTLTAKVVVSAAFCATDLPAQSSTQGDAPPRARADTVWETHHGVRVADPFRWLETESAERAAWVTAQDGYTRALLESLPIRDSVMARFAEGPPSVLGLAFKRAGGRTFGVLNGPGGEVLVRYDGDGSVDTLIAVSAYGAGVAFAVNPGNGNPSFEVSPDGRYAAFGLTRGQNLFAEWYVRDLETGEDLPDVLWGLAGLPSTVWWHPDGQSLFYPRYVAPKETEGPPSQLRDQRVFHHRLGTSQAEDALVFEDPSHPDRYAQAMVARDGSALYVAQVDGGHHVLYRIDPRRPGGSRRVLSSVAASFQLVDAVADTLWLQTSWRAPLGRIVRVVDPGGPQSQVDEIVPETKSLAGATAAGAGFLLHYVHGGEPSLIFVQRDGSGPVTLDLPYVGWVPAGFSGRPGDSKVVFELQGTADPGSQYALDLRTRNFTVLHTTDPAYDASRYVTRHVRYESHDGTEVPLFLMARRDLGFESPRPTWLYAYGHGGWPAAPWYQPQHRAWLDRGGVYALAHVRGGGEFGEAWTNAGSRELKENGLADYVRAAEFLIERGITSSELLVANGGSASGPLAAAAVLRRPDLWAAAIIDYPVTDLVRFTEFGGAASWMKHFGSPNEPTEFEALLAWSPYHNVEPGTCYPPTLLSHGDQDQFAPTLHSYKFVAALQDAQACDRPILLQVAWGLGHTVGGRDERTNQLAFLLNALGPEAFTSETGTR